MNGAGIEDLDIPDSVFEFLHKAVPKGFAFDAKTFRWQDKGGREHGLKDIDDAYLTNIVNFLERRVLEMDVVAAVYFTAVQSFLIEELERREAEVFCG